MRARAKALARAWPRLVGWGIAVCGSMVALLAPSRVFDAALLYLIGQSGVAGTTSAQRVIAAVGALNAGVVLARVGRSSDDVLARVARWRIASFAAPFAALVVWNAWRVLALAGITGAPPRIASWVWTTVAVLLVGSALPVLLAPRASTLRGRASWRALSIASGTGLGYGIFSALWHCCPPLWRLDEGGGATLDALVWLAALPLSLGAIGRVCSTLRPGAGELAGAILLGVFYPWHTPMFFVQCLAGGAFATWLVRVSQSAWAPTVFLLCAFTSHMTLPFLGWAGVVAALALLAVHARAQIAFPDRRRAAEL